MVPTEVPKVRESSECTGDSEKVGQATAEEAAEEAAGDKVWSEDGP